LAVQSDVGCSFTWFSSREAVPALIFAGKSANAFYVGTLPVLVGVWSSNTWFSSREAIPAFIFAGKSANASYVGTLPVLVGVWSSNTLN
jgi:electron transfer flavoprotein alpha/beta subunit